MAASPADSLIVAIGGALDFKRPRLLQTLIALAGGEDARIGIIPTASAEQQSGALHAQAFQAAGLRQPPVVLEIHERAAALAWDDWRPLEHLSAFFFTGGSQLRLTTILGGTPLLEALLAAHQRGAVIAGTSAGAAVLGSVMIAFGQRGASPRVRQAQFAPGLGFVPHLLFDQHFRQRDRLGRLLYAVAQHPGLLGVGLDENTAAVVDGERLSITGQNAVTLVDGRNMQVTDLAEIESFAPFAVSGLTLHVLTHGCSYDFATRKVTLPQKSRPAA